MPFNAISDRLMMNSNDSKLLLCYYQIWIIVITIISFNVSFKNVFAAEEFICKLNIIFLVKIITIMRKVSNF